MISLEIAKKLKKAGLQWEPKYGDFYYDINLNRDLVNGGMVGATKIMSGCYIYAPRLDQLLAEIEERGYAYELRIVIDQSSGTARILGYWICVWKIGSEQWKSKARFHKRTPEDAAGCALLWILQNNR